MWKQTHGSPRFVAGDEQQNTSILSPRNFLRLLSNGFDELRKVNLNSPNSNNYQQYVTTFNPYLLAFKDQYNKYQQSKIKNQCGFSKNDQLQLELKINRIPQQFFNDSNSFKLQLYKRGEMTKKQEELSEYLDEIEVVLFTKSGKYPQKSHIILQNMNQLQSYTNQSLQRVIDFRKGIKSKIMINCTKQLKIKRINQKIALLKKTQQYCEVMKKLRDLKLLSASKFEGKMLVNEEMLLKIKKNQLNAACKFTSLKTIIVNIQSYRLKVKQNLYRQFVGEVQLIFNKLLKYNRSQWKNINMAQLSTQSGNLPNLSHNNITILNESYFAFDADPINIIRQTNQPFPQAIAEESQSQNQPIIVDLAKISKLWVVIKQLDLYDQAQLNQNFTRIMVKHSTVFNNDMHDYVKQLNTSAAKQKAALGGSILRGTTYASLKNRQQVFQEQGSVNNVAGEWSDQKLSQIEMKHFLKVVKFYFQLLKKVLSFITNHKDLQFLTKFKQKFCEFLQGRIHYFANLRKVSDQVSTDDFFLYLQIFNYWMNEEYYEIYDHCQTFRNNKIDQYLTNIQKNLLIKEIKTNIEQSNYLPVNLESQNYMIFHFLLTPNNPYEDEMNMSLTVNYELDEAEENEVVLRLINKNIYFKNKIYKICDSFLNLIKDIERYVRLKQHLPQFQQNIEQKTCQIIGFYVWYNNKNLNNTKNGAKTLKNYCTFYSTLLFLKQIVSSLKITNKKFEKTRLQIAQCETQLVKTITMTPFMMIQQKISQIYESRISTRTQVPTVETQRIIDILKISMDCLKEYFSIEKEEKLGESLVYKFLQTTIKLLHKNYFGYLANMQKRGIAEIKWFLPKLKQILQITLLSNSLITNKKGQFLCLNGNNTFYIFNQEIQDMQRILKQKSMGK